MIRNLLSDKAKFGLLSPRERQVIDLTLVGCQDKSIGLQLGLSPRAVMTYRQAAYKKLGVRDRAELVQLATDAGLI